GLRCAYQGWCYDSSGQCVDTPLEPAHSKLAERVRIAGYPVREMGGLLFAYMGPAPAPVLPPWDVLVWPNSIRQIGYTEIPCNWLQCQENAADPVHSVYLHGHLFRYVLEREGLLEQRAPDPDTHRAFVSMRLAAGFDSVEATVDDHGIVKHTVHRAELGAPQDLRRQGAYLLFPNAVRVGGTIRNELQIRVPIDDTTTLHFNYATYVAPPGVEAPSQDRIPCYEVPIVDANGRPILDYILAQDMVAWWSQGAVTDRTAERLASTDSALRRFRQLLEEQLAAVEAGRDPMNVFREPVHGGGPIDLPPVIGSAPIGPTALSRLAYHRGYFQDDADRYGPLVDDIIELSRRVEAILGADLAAPGPPARAPR
ncbi:MAG: Rieske 2Fe-2S domain-containing protein, partial [Acidimicrobiales bacterium]